MSFERKTYPVQWIKQVKLMSGGLPKTLSLIRFSCFLCNFTMCSGCVDLIDPLPKIITPKVTLEDGNEDKKGS